MGSDSLIHKKILVVTAVKAEQEAVLRGLNGDNRFTVAVAGVGPAAAAACTALHLASGGYGLAVSAGIGGGFEGAAELGALVVSSYIIAADLGVETIDGFASVEELGFGTSFVQADGPIAARLTGLIKEREANLAVAVGPVLTVSTATGTSATAEKLLARYPLAAAEAMEGFGVAAAASAQGIPCLELRGISNRVGPRNRAEWRIPDALAAVERAFTYIPEVLV